MSPSPPRNRLAGPLVLLGTVLLIVAIDRALLAYLGVPRWEADPVLYFRPRPNVRRTWAAYPGGKPLRTNQLGFYDDDFPRAKPPGEFRALAIGDSVIMGHGVTTDEALPNQLEARLSEHHAGSPTPFRSYQVVNAGVEGYWTDQYVEVLRRNLDLGPDLVVIGFCLNDVIAVYPVDRAHGGPGVDFHGIQQVQLPWLSTLANETGFGRLAVRLRQTSEDRDWAARRRFYGVRRLTRHSYDDPAVIEGWQHALDNLATAYDIARTHDIPVVLLILPYRFQLGRTDLQEPQRILARHADTFGVAHLDATPPLEAALADGAKRPDLFLDEDHLQVRGHALLAEALYAFVTANDLIHAAPAPTPAP